ncbi:MAG: tRNA dihydrouridine synthase DusB [Leptolinea sp.]|jgi:nifR3 family TIM-barrel protein|nr:tRNA dihydrouridine synthase DusB [Leptolinea sp.]
MTGLSIHVEQTPDFYIGNIPVHGRLILAPMDGYTDHPFRLICRRWGSACSYSEFINAMDLEGRHPHIGDRMAFTDDERPFGFQILDNSPERIHMAAGILRQRNPDFLDLNLGCCSRSVCSRGAGASLMRDPEKITRIVQMLVTTMDIPITAKMRLGWDEKSRNYLEVAHLIEDAGASALAVHGRTRNQLYSGCADWDAIARIKQELKIPVIGNGDVTRPEDIHRFFTHTACDALMIGRGAVGNPWIFAYKNRSDCSRQEIFQTIREHLKASIRFYGEEHGLIVFRKQAVNYLRDLWPSEEFRRELLTTNDRPAFMEKIQSLIENTSSLC